MKHHFTLAAAALILTACSDSPVAPIALTAAATAKPAFSSAAAGTQLDYTDQANDMITRVLPSFDDPQVADAVRESLLALNAHAIVGEIADAQAASRAARSALTEGAASALVLGAVTATLDVIDRDLASVAPTAADVVLAN
jgi:hypothetical protein